MPTTYKILASNSSAGNYGNGAQTIANNNTNYNVYTVPAGTSTVVSTIVLCNRSASALTFRLAVRPAGATIANQHYIAYDTAIAANDSVMLTLGLTLAATDVITVYTSAATSFTIAVYGSEIT